MTHPFYAGFLLRLTKSVLKQLETTTPSTLLVFFPSSILLLRLHSLLCALHNKTEDKQKPFAKWVGYLFPVTLLSHSCQEILLHIDPEQRNFHLQVSYHHKLDNYDVEYKNF